MNIMNFKASFELADFETKKLKQRKGYAKVSNTLLYGGLSQGALYLYLNLIKFSERISISDDYLRLFLKSNTNTKLPLAKLRSAKRELIELKLLEIKKTYYHRINFEWIVKNEKGEVVKHFNKDKIQNILEAKKELKCGTKNTSKNLENSTFSTGANSPLENEKNKNSLYIETRTRDNKFINNINLNFNNLENLEEDYKKQEKERVSHNETSHFAENATKINQKDLDTMAKKEKKVFIPPTRGQLIEEIRAFNKKYNCNISDLKADMFISYYKQDDGRWIMSNGKALKDWKKALINTWLFKDLENQQKSAKWRKPCVSDTWDEETKKEIFAGLGVHLEDESIDVKLLK